MGDMIERLASQLCGELGPVSYAELPESASYLQRKSTLNPILDRQEARTIIEDLLRTLRVPTMDMIEAGQETNNLLENPDPPNAFKFLSRDEMTEAWQAMIDTALSEQK